MRFGVLLLLLALIGGPSVAAAIPLYEAEFRDVSTRNPGRGRVHLAIHTATTNGAYWTKVSNVALVQDAVEVELEVMGSGSGPTALTPRTIPLTIDQLPEGNVVLRLTEKDSNEVFDEIQLDVSTDRPLEPPAPVSIWPRNPTVLDEVWLLVEPIFFCSEIQFGARYVDQGGSISVNELTRPCQEGAESPKLAAFNLGVIPEDLSTNSGAFELSRARKLTYRVDGTSVGESARSQIYIDMPIEDRIPTRISGSWYNPDQAGHGMTIEMTDQGKLLLYWFTFDLEGDAAWIVAVGEPTGRQITLEAVTVSGGHFPPEHAAEKVATEAWGTIELEFISCGEALLSWQTERSGFSSGSMNLERLSRHKAHSCSGPPPDSILVPTWYQGPGTWFVLPRP